MSRRNSLFILAFITACGAVGFAATEDVSVDERLRRLETTVESLQRENADLRRQLGADDAKPGSGVPSAAVAPNGHETKLVIGGYIHAQAEFGDAGDERWAGTNDRFYFRRARFYVAGRFAEHFEFKVEGDFSANSLTPATGVRAIANDVWIGWNRYDFAVLRFGQLKPAFGAEQLLSDLKLATIERSLPNDRLTDPRQIGLELGGEFLNHRLGYLAFVGNGNGPSSSANDNNKFMPCTPTMPASAARASGSTPPPAGRSTIFSLGAEWGRASMQPGTTVCSTSPVSTCACTSTPAIGCRSRASAPMVGI
jgi:hypothetical protein